jgi:hypothetical protein
MPWQKGENWNGQPGPGRKGFELEEAEKEKMRGIVNISLKKLQKIQSGKATKKEMAEWATVSGTVNKIIDKFAANKTDIKVEGGDKPILIKNGS